MTPAAYNATRKRLGLTHAETAELLRISHGTSRNWSNRMGTGTDERAEAQLKLIEHIGVDETRRLLGINGK